jgi:hypothetical protein
MPEFPLLNSLETNAAEIEQKLTQALPIPEGEKDTDEYHGVDAQFAQRQTLPP